MAKKKKQKSVLLDEHKAELQTFILERADVLKETPMDSQQIADMANDRFKFYNRAGRLIEITDCNIRHIFTWKTIKAAGIKLKRSQSKPTGGDRIRIVAKSLNRLWELSTFEQEDSQLSQLAHGWTTAEILAGRRAPREDNTAEDSGETVDRGSEPPPPVSDNPAG